MPAHVKSRHRGQPRSTRRGGPSDGRQSKRRLSKSRRRKRASRNIVRKGQKWPKVLYLVFAIVVLFLLLFSKSSYWDTASKIAIVFNGSDGPQIVVFDKELEEITQILIPKDTETQVSRQLGTWKIGSVWQLGENEKLGGKLLAESITFHLKFPVYAWADRGVRGFVSGGPFSFIKAIILPYKTNLSFADRLKLAQFTLRVREFKKSEIKLSQTSAVRPTKLIDGSEGYQLTGLVPAGILALFSDTQIAQSQTRVVIHDATAKYKLAEEVGEIIEVMGAKVTAIKKEDNGNYDCKVTGADKKSLEKVALFLGCEKSAEEVTGSFDLEIYLGSEFPKRF